MENSVVLIVVPVFLVIGLGFAINRVGLLNSDFLYHLNRLVYYIALPALLFYKIGTADFSANFNGVLLGCLAAAIVAMFAFSYLFGVARGYPPPVLGAFCQGAFRGNFAYVGLAIVYNAFGEEGFTKAGILLGFIVPLLNFLSVVALLMPSAKSATSTGVRFWVRQLAANPLIIASFAGILWSYLQLPIPQVVDRALHIVTGMSLPLALISIGAGFSFQRLRGDLALTVLVTVLKIVVLPTLVAALLVMFGVTGQDLAIGVLLAGTPTATAAYIMAQQMNGDAELSGAIIMLSTLCSLGTYTLALYLLRMSGI